MTGGQGQGSDKGRRVLEVFLAALVILIICFLARTLLPRVNRQSTPEHLPSKPQRPVTRRSAPVAHPPRPTEEHAVSTPTQHPLAQPPPAIPDEPPLEPQSHDSTRSGQGSNKSEETPRRTRGANLFAGASTWGIVRILRISTNETPTPVYEIRNHANPERPPRLWYVITVEYESRPKWIDEITFDYWVMLGGPDGAGAMVLSKRITYLVVERGVHRSVTYLHPNTFARFGAARDIAVSVSLGGQEVAYASLTGDQNRSWLISTDHSRLLSRRDTPFWLIDYDAFEFEKPKSDTAEQGAEGDADTRAP